MYLECRDSVGFHVLAFYFCPDFFFRGFRFFALMANVNAYVIKLEVVVFLFRFLLLHVLVSLVGGDR